MAPLPLRTPSRLDLIFVLPALLVGAALLLRVNAFVTDDAAITLRYALSLADGHGLRWNANVAHPVEGYSNFSHVVLGALAWKLDLPPLQLLRALNQGAAVLACVLTYALGLHALGSRLWAGAAALLLAAHAPLWYWSTSGLETGVYTAAVYGSLLAFLRARPGALWPAPVFLVAALTRFEGPAVFAACALAAFAGALRARASTPLIAHARWVALFLLAYAAYFAFRFSYFDHLLPNSAYYKRGEPLDPLLLWQFGEHCWPLLGLAIGARYARLGPLGVALLALLALHAVGFLGVAPSVAYFHRFFLPVVPALALLAASAAQRVWDAPWPPQLARGLAVVLFGSCLTLDVLHPASGVRAVSAAVDALNSRMVARAEAAAFLARRFDPRATVAVEDVGVLGYALPNPVLDLLGLNDEAYVHALSKERAAHAINVLQQEPEVIALASKRADRFQASYRPGALFSSFSDFGRRYRHVHTVSAPLDHYHLFVFVRRRAPPPAALTRTIAFDRAGSLARGIDQLARAIRQPR
jgi:hypothetical protein